MEFREVLDVSKIEHVSTFELVTSHLSELKELLNNIKNPSSNKLIFQKLPKHMRRRAMSHNPKRLPRKYRSMYISQMLKSGKPCKKKRPSRKYRRKPSNLLKEYIRRQQKNIWLETHIWHAKRFHMVSKWGYKVPQSSCNKSYRANYRATANYCLLHDMSYLCCVELQGSIKNIGEKFKLLTQIENQLSITARMYISGKFEGSVDIFQPGKYPNGALGKVNFLWKSEENFNNKIRTLWIFIHPSCYKEILSVLIEIYQLEATNSYKISVQSDDNQTQIMNKTLTSIRIPIFVNKEKEIVLKELKDTMNRFHLTGPMSVNILNKAFRCKQISSSKTSNSWFDEYCKNEKNIQDHITQAKFWDELNSINASGLLHSRMILSLNIEDPRINRSDQQPKQATKDNDIDYKNLLTLPHGLCNSPIWDLNIRDKISKSMLTTHEICLQRKNCVLVPGTRSNLDDMLQPIPILLIQRPGSEDSSYKRLSYGSGWDLIIPSGYGLSIWLSLILCGAKPGGLDDLLSIYRESGQEQFLPDSVSGKKMNIELYNELREKYFRRPPNKRNNYMKLAINSPFKCEFQSLVNNWNQTKTEEQFFVLRNKKLLFELNESFKKNNNFPQLPNGCLIPVYIKMKTRGSPQNLSIICLPKTKDLKKNLRYKKYYLNEQVYTEPLCKDNREMERKNLRKKHEKILKYLRRRRVREKRKLQETSNKQVKISPTNTSQLIIEQFKNMSKLWLPENPENVRYQCTREVFGYITQSSFSYTESTVCGIGYVVWQGLLNIAQLHKNTEKLVLVRSPNSRCYRFASIKINCSV